MRTGTGSSDRLSGGSSERDSPAGLTSGSEGLTVASAVLRAGDGDRYRAELPETIDPSERWAIAPLGPLRGCTHPIMRDQRLRAIRS